MRFRGLLTSFNPSVGILGGQTVYTVMFGSRLNGFNPSVGILGGQTYLQGRLRQELPKFQSLSRDSWWSN